MTQILTTSADKFAVLDEIDRLVYRHLVAGLKRSDREAILSHMSTLRSEPGDLNVNFRFETVPELSSTRIHLELSFSPVPSFSDPVQKKI